MEQERRAVTYRLPAGVLDRIADESLKRDVGLTDIVLEALREKFDRIDSGEDAGWGPLSGLPKEDRERVVKFIECLRASPENRGFRRAVDANFAWLMETITER